MENDYQNYENIQNDHQDYQDYFDDEFDDSYLDDPYQNQNYLDDLKDYMDDLAQIQEDHGESLYDYFFSLSQKKYCKCNECRSENVFHLIYNIFSVYPSISLEMLDYFENRMIPNVTKGKTKISNARYNKSKKNFYLIMKKVILILNNSYVSPFKDMSLHEKFIFYSRYGFIDEIKIIIGEIKKEKKLEFIKKRELEWTNYLKQQN